jgi:hypothetical protein
MATTSAGGVRGGQVACGASSVTEYSTRPSRSRSDTVIGRLAASMATWPKNW